MTGENARHRCRDLPQLDGTGSHGGGGLQPGPREGRSLPRRTERAWGQGSVHQGNVGSADDCRRTIAEVIERYCHLDILVPNAGITIDRTVLKMTDEDWFKVMDVNLSGAFFLSHAVLPHMIERAHGRILNISSIIGEQGNIGQANYAASKFGLFGLTKTLAREAAFSYSARGHCRTQAST